MEPAPLLYRIWVGNQSIHIMYFLAKPNGDELKLSLRVWYSTFKSLPAKFKSLPFTLVGGNIASVLLPQQKCL